MGFLKKFGSFFGGGSGTKTQKKYGGDKIEQAKMPQSTAVTTDELQAGIQSYHDAVAKAAQEAREKLAADRRRLFDVGQPTRQQPGSLHDIYLEELAQEATEDFERRKRHLEHEEQRLDPLLRFLAGEEVEVVSTNVGTIRYDREHSQLYILFKKNHALYRYFNVNADEAASLFRANSMGKWVWDNLRIRGTVFGFQKDYEFISASFSGYAPKYTYNQTWMEEHTAIPAEGWIPENWIVSEAPYSLPWLVKMNPKVFPKAKITRRKGKVGDGKEPIGKWLGQI